MRSFTTLIRRNINLRAPSAQPVEVYDPAAIRDRLNRSMRRRFADDLENLIKRACLTGHFEAAEALLRVLREQLEREERQYPHGRHAAGPVIQELADQIASASRRRLASAAV